MKEEIVVHNLEFEKNVDHGSNKLVRAKTNINNHNGRCSTEELDLKADFSST